MWGEAQVLKGQSHRQTWHNQEKQNHESDLIIC